MMHRAPSKHRNNLVRRTVGLAFSGILAAGLLATPTAIAAEPAAAETASATEVGTLAKPNCDGDYKTVVARTYNRRPVKGNPTVLADGILRCGNSNWGYRHIEKRWSDDFEDKLKATLVDWDKKDESGNKTIYCKKYAVSDDKYWFKVVWSTGDVDTDPGINLYIVTATWDAKNLKGCDNF